MKHAGFLKKSMVVILTAAIVIGIPTAQAFAKGSSADAKYDATKAFLEAMDNEGYKYDYKGIADSGDEQVSSSFSADGYGGEITFDFYFDEDGEDFDVFANDLVIATAGEKTVLKTINQLNYDYRFVTFYYQEDGSIDASYNGSLVGVDDIGANVIDILYWMDSVLDYEEVYETLEALE